MLAKISSFQLLVVKKAYTINTRSGISDLFRGEYIFIQFRTNDKYPYHWVY
jgi:hypothetical protein